MRKKENRESYPTCQRSRVKKKKKKELSVAPAQGKLHKDRKDY